MGGRVYDAVVARCATKGKAAALLTFNAPYFLSPAIADLHVVVPGRAWSLSWRPSAARRSDSLPPSTPHDPVRLFLSKVASPKAVLQACGVTPSRGPMKQDSVRPTTADLDLCRFQFVALQYATCYFRS